MKARIVAAVALLTALGAGGWLAVASEAAGPNRLGTAGFESPAVTSAARFGASHTIGMCGGGALAEQPQPGCWRTTKGSVDLVPAGAIPAHSGSRYLDLNGRAKGQVAQQVTASPGVAHELTYFARSSRNQAMEVIASIYWYDSTGQIIATSGFFKATATFGAWTKFRVESTSPAGTAWARVYLTSDTQPAFPNTGAGPLVDTVVFRTV